MLTKNDALIAALCKLKQNKLWCDTRPSYVVNLNKHTRWAVKRYSEPSKGMKTIEQDIFRRSEKQTTTVETTYPDTTNSY